MKKERKFQFKEFRTYAGFLLGDQNLLKEIAALYMEQIRNSHVPTMQFLLRLPSPQALSLIRNNFQNFLEQSLNDTAFTSAEEKISMWRDRSFSRSSRKEKEIDDIIRVYGIQNQLLINHLSAFTQEYFTFSTIVQELEDFLQLIEETAFNIEVLHEGGRVFEYFSTSNLGKGPEERSKETVPAEKEGEEREENQTQAEGRLEKLEEANVEKETALQDLERRNLNLQKINSYLGNFVFVASHDLRTPVSNLESLLQMLRESFLEKADAEEAQILKMTELATGSLKKTIEDLLEAIKAQKETNEGTVEEGKVRFQQITQEVKDDIHSLILENKALIVEEFNVEEIAYPRANLRSIIYNLLSNAVKYGASDRPLLVEVSNYLQDDHVVLSVKDNGMGLTLDQLKNLFTMFNRMHQHVEGIGIGLYSIKKMVESSGGKIDVKSEKGKGTEFLVYLPKR